MNKRTAAVGLALLLAGAIYLSYLAIGHAGTFDGASQAVDNNADSQTTGPRQDQPDTMLAIGDDGVVLRAVTGDCSSNGSASDAGVEVSIDDGASFSTVFKNLPQVMGISAVSQAELSFVDADERCSPGVQRSSDTGATWTRATVTKGLWHLSPGVNDVVVHASEGAVDAGCTTIVVAPVSAEVAYIGCDDGAVRVTRNAGKEWTDVAAVKGLVGLTFNDATTGFALAKSSDCAAEVLASTDAGETWDQTACLKGNEPKAIASNGQSTRIISQVDKTVRFSDDNGETWQSAG